MSVEDFIISVYCGVDGLYRRIVKHPLRKRGFMPKQTPLRKNMHDIRPKAFVNQLMSTRHLVETVIGPLTERFP